MRTISGLLGGYLLWTVGRLAGNRLCHDSGCIGGWGRLGRLERVARFLVLLLPILELCYQGLCSDCLCGLDLK